VSLDGRLLASSVDKNLFRKKKLDQSKKKKFEKKIGSAKVYQFNEPTQYVGERHLNLETNGKRKELLLL
jgi:hypothetical protein